MRSRAPLVATVILLLVSGVMATPHSPGCGEAMAFAAPQRPYVAFRRLEAENQKSGRQGWLDVRTELGTDGLLTVEVLDEGGSEYIRNKVLRAALDGERQLIATRSAGPVPSVDTTTCNQSQVDGSGVDASGLVRVPVKPEGRATPASSTATSSCSREPATSFVSRDGWRRTHPSGFRRSTSPGLTPRSTTISSCRCPSIRSRRSRCSDPRRST
jgi:hypothetical protein